MRTSRVIRASPCWSAWWPPPVARPQPSWFLPPPSIPRPPSSAPHLWDGTGRAPVTNAVTVVRGDRILCAGAAGECPVPQGARVIDARGQYLIPGLIDSHVHLLFLMNGSAGEELGLDLRDLLAQGITTVRDMGTNPAALLSRVSGFEAAPRVYAMQLVAGRRFFFNGFRAVQTERGVVVPAGAGADDAVRWAGLPSMFNRGRRSRVGRRGRPARPGRWGSSSTPSSTACRVRRLTAAAHRAGMPVWGHAWLQPASVGEQSAAGMDGVVHAAGLAGELFTRRGARHPRERRRPAGGHRPGGHGGSGARSAHPRDPRLDGRARHDVRADPRRHPAQPG